jgi:hypothetical protein
MRLAQTGRAMAQAQADLTRAEAMDNRLRQLLDALPRSPGPVSVASLRDTGLMLTQLAAEAAEIATAATAARARVGPPGRARRPEYASAGQCALSAHWVPQNARTFLLVLGRGEGDLRGPSGAALQAAGGAEPGSTGRRAARWSGSDGSGGSGRPVPQPWHPDADRRLGRTHARRSPAGPCCVERPAEAGIRAFWSHSIVADRVLPVRVTGVAPAASKEFLDVVGRSAGARGSPSCGPRAASDRGDTSRPPGVASRQCRSVGAAIGQFLHRPAIDRQERRSRTSRPPRSRI